MDLDMIQDLLGGTNLPPPPSVEDLLGEVVQVAHSPSPPLPAAAPSQQTSALDVSAEHSYSKTAMEEGAEPMEQDVIIQAPGYENLAELNLNFDCYEAFLLNLLKVYTQNKMEETHSSNVESSRTNTTTSSTEEPEQCGQNQHQNLTTTSSVEGGNSEVFTIGSISPDAITALSQEQVQSLVTSNSANYDVVHQILAFRQRGEGGGEGGGGKEGGGGREGGGGGGVKGQEEEEKDESGSAAQQLQSLQLTSEQLKQIQLQMEEMIRSKQIVLPTNLSLDRQQQLLQSLILKQIHSQHLSQPPQTTTTSSQQTQATPTNQLVATPTPAPPAQALSTSIPTGDPSKATVGSTLASMLRGEHGSDSGGVGGGGGAMKLEIPPITNIRSSGTSVVKAEEGSPKATGSSSGGIATRSSGGWRKKKDVRGSTEEEKKPSSPYGVFFSDVYPSVLQANPKLTLAEASKLISAMWNAMGLDTKKQYHERSEKQKDMYQTHVTSPKSEATPTSDEPLTSPKTAVAAALEEGGDGVSERVSQAIATQTVPPPPPPPPPPNAGTLKLMVKDIKHCMNEGCFKDAVYTEFRGPRYCSNECVVQHCKIVFQEWVSQRKLAT